ncbi:hypothetical protein ACFXGY_30415, partial [Streptomyces sp. NPDC059346]
MLRLRYWDGLSSPEIADRFGLRRPPRPGRARPRSPVRSGPAPGRRGAGCAVRTGRPAAAVRVRRRGPHRAREGSRAPAGPAPGLPGRSPGPATAMRRGVRPASPARSPVRPGPPDVPWRAVRGLRAGPP